MKAYLFKPLNRLTALFAATLVTAMFMAMTTTPAEARDYRTLSDVLEANGLTTLRTALEAAGLLHTLNDNHVTVFAPTNDVFAATAKALGCVDKDENGDALALATALLGIQVDDDTDALTAILTLHAALDRRSVTTLLLQKHVNTLNGENITTGVNAGGVYVQAAENVEPINITNDDIHGKKFRLYPIDGVLLPFVPQGPVCIENTQ